MLLNDELIALAEAATVDCVEEALGRWYKDGRPESFRGFLEDDLLQLTSLATNLPAERAAVCAGSLCLLGSVLRGEGRDGSADLRSAGKWFKLVSAHWGTRHIEPDGAVQRQLDENWPAVCTLLVRSTGDTGYASLRDWYWTFKEGADTWEVITGSKLCT